MAAYNRKDWSAACFVLAMLRTTRVPGPALGAVLLAPCLLLQSVRADPIDPVDPIVPAHDPRTIGTGVGSLVLDVPVLDPDATHRRYDAGLGFSFQVVGGRAHWPFMFGLAGGLLLFDSASHDGLSPATAGRTAR